MQPKAAWSCKVTKDLVSRNSRTLAVGHKERYAVTPLVKRQAAMPVEMCGQLRKRRPQACCVCVCPCVCMFYMSVLVVCVSVCEGERERESVC
jgi:hypothetical protein